MASFPIAGTSESSACSRSPRTGSCWPGSRRWGHVGIVRLAALPAPVGGLRGHGDGLRRADSRIHGITAHFATVAIACASVFSALITAQCLLLLVFRRRAAQAASVTFQVLFAVGLVELLVPAGAGPHPSRRRRLARRALHAVGTASHVVLRPVRAARGSSRREVDGARRAGDGTDDRDCDYGDRSLCRELRPSVTAGARGRWHPERLLFRPTVRSRGLAGGRASSGDCRAVRISRSGPFSEPDASMMFAVYGDSDRDHSCHLPFRSPSATMAPGSGNRASASCRCRWSPSSCC